ncbi:MAG: hypothetical protein U9N07_03560 [Euryarchaeota archaeon]|nr:hypothetical protein [Euryarchaeota archaeon]
MRQSKGIGIGAVFTVLLMAAFALVPMVSAESDMSAKVIETSGTKTTFAVGSVEITVDNYPDLTGATVILKCGDTTDRYTVKVETSDNIYIAKIYDADGKLVRTRHYSSNPLVTPDGGQPLIINGIIVDAFIDIWPDKYAYSQSENGTVNIHVDNYAFPSGAANYYLRIPGDVEYIEVYDGQQPFSVHDLPTSDDYVWLPECGKVYGPATVLYWQALHLFGYEEYIKVKVKYDSAGSFTHYAYDHEQEILSGLPAWDDDSFRVTVS